MFRLHGTRNQSGSDDHESHLRLPNSHSISRQGLLLLVEDWTKLFPTEVVRWMVDKKDPSARQARTEHGEELVPLPEMHDLPIIVAIRMSLSFPILLTAVPLYAVDYSMKRNDSVPEEQPIVADPCWFSDGGISSNFLCISLIRHFQGGRLSEST